MHLPCKQSQTYSKMPSKSRKKIKGQARKANKAKAAAANNVERQYATNSIGREQTLPNNTHICKHGLEESNTTSFECNNFIDTFFQFFSENILRLTNPGSTAKLTADALSEAYNKFPEAVNNESNREIVKKNLVYNGVSSLLGISGQSIMASSCAIALLYIDSYDPSCPIPSGQPDDRDAKVWVRNLDILSGCCQRSLVKFFVNSSPCNCLDEVYAQIKSTTPKMGKCMGCNQIFERTAIFICTGCERVTYCSKPCQIANVPKHKLLCKLWQKYDRDNNTR